MSRYTTEKIACPECNAESEFLVWSSINTMSNPEMKEKVRTREAFRSICPCCGHTTYVDYGFLYHQMEDKIMIYYVQNMESYNQVFDMFSGESMHNALKEITSSEYMKRIVMSQDELSEKLLIFDNELDDRVIELAKVLFASVPSEQGVKVTEMLFDISENGEYLLHVFSEEKCVGSMDFPKMVYQELYDTYIVQRPAIREDRFDIDRGWAYEVLGIEVSE